MNWLKKLFRFESPGPLGGRWEGFYVQDNVKHRVEAVFDHRGTRLTGTMIDINGVVDVPLQQLMIENNWTDQQKSDFENELRGMLPETKGEPIIFRSILPNASSLSGTIDDAQIHFTKIYHGDVRYEYLIGDCAVDGESEPNYPIEYTATIDSNQDAITGHWIIHCSDHSDEPEVPREVFGQFELRRSV